MTDIIVVGGGPAGLTAALYARRAGKQVTLIEQESTGGQIVYSPLVENYPAMPGLSGAEFARKLTEQVGALGAEIVYDQVTGLRRQADGTFTVACGGSLYPCRAVVLATGLRHRHLGLDGEEELVGAGISYCAVCDGAFYAGRDTAVVGGGDTALQDALFLAESCRHVTLLHRRDTFRAEAALVAKVAARQNITLLYSHTAARLVRTDGALTGLVVQDLKTGHTRELPAEGLFVAVGQMPNSEPFAAQIAAEQGYYRAGEDTLTTMPGVFAAGDGRTKTVRQLTTAVGDGAVAGLAACRWVDGLR